MREEERWRKGEKESDGEERRGGREEEERGGGGREEEERGKQRVEEVGREARNYLPS